MNTSTKGQRAEQIAAEIYLGQGYQLEAQNYRTRRGELDLVFTSSQEIVFVEVKSQTREGVFPLSLAVQRSKRRRCRLAAQEFLARRRDLLSDSKDLRFDVVLITGNRVFAHYKGEDFYR